MGRPRKKQDIPMPANEENFDVEELNAVPDKDEQEQIEKMTAEVRRKDENYDVDVTEMFAILSNPSSVDPMVKRAAEDWLVERFDPFVRQIAKKNYRTYLENHGDDLIQAGWCGLLSNIHKYDPKRGKPESFLWLCVKNAMYRHIGFVMGQAEHTRGDEKKIREAKATLSKMGNDNPTIIDLAIETGLDVQTTKRALLAMERRENVVSLSDESISGRVADGKLSNPQTVAENNELVSVLHGAIDEYLSDVEKYVIIARFGLNGNPVQSIASIVQDIGLGAAEIPKLEARALDKLRSCAPLNAYYYDWKLRQSMTRTASARVPLLSTPTEAGMSMLADIQAADDFSGL